MWCLSFVMFGSAYASSVAALKRLNLHTSDKSGPFYSFPLLSPPLLFFPSLLLPLRPSQTPWSDLHYIASELEGLAGGNHCVVAFTIWAHFTTYPVGVYLHPLAVIRRAVSPLLRRAPDTPVLTTTADPPYINDFGSN